MRGNTNWGHPRQPAPPMPQGLAARLGAQMAIAEVITVGRTLDDVFAASSLNPKLSGLDSRDLGLARGIALVALRHFGTIRRALNHYLEKGMPKKAGNLEWILVSGAAQILFMDVPDHAAVDLSVHAIRNDPKTAGFAALVNGVLRNIIRGRETILENIDSLGDDTPQWLAQRWRKAYGEEAAQAIARMNAQEPSLDLTVREDAAGWAQKLGGIVLPTGSVRLVGHDEIASLPGYDEGAWWVQDAAAALPARLLNVRPGERVADLCAAPGGKTAQLAVAGARVVAVDKSAERLKRMRVNLERLKLDVEVAVADATNFDAPSFDAILLDAPCTATGTIRRHPDVAWVKKPTDITTLAALQARLLDRAARLLKPGGRLVYCTCSLEPEEGPAQIEALLRRSPDLARAPIAADEIGGLAQAITPEGDLRTLPHFLGHETPRLSGLDGFYAARLMRAQ